MSRSNTPKKHSAPLDRSSEVRAVTYKILPLVDELGERATPQLKQRIYGTIRDARRQLEETVTNDNEQGLLFQGPNEDNGIDVRYAEELIRMTESSLDTLGVCLEQTRDAIKIVAKIESDDAYRDIGY